MYIWGKFSGYKMLNEMHRAVASGRHGTLLPRRTQITAKMTYSAKLLLCPFIMYS